MEKYSQVKGQYWYKNVHQLALNDLGMQLSLGQIVLVHLSSGNCKKEIQTIKQQENSQVVLLHLSERLLNF